MYQFTADYHIGADSVVKNRAQSTNLAGDTLVDIDGDARAAGTATVDCGADEVP